MSRHSKRQKPQCQEKKVMNQKARILQPSSPFTRGRGDLSQVFQDPLSHPPRCVHEWRLSPSAVPWLWPPELTELKKIIKPPPGLHMPEPAHIHREKISKQMGRGGLLAPQHGSTLIHLRQWCGSRYSECFRAIKSSRGPWCLRRMCAVIAHKFIQRYFTPWLPLRQKANSSTYEHSRQKWTLTEEKKKKKP